MYLISSQIVEYVVLLARKELSLLNSPICHKYWLILIQKLKTFSFSFKVWLCLIHLFQALKILLLKFFICIVLKILGSDLIYP